MAVLSRLGICLLSVFVASCGGGGNEGFDSAAPVVTAKMARAVAPSCGYDHIYITVEKVVFEASVGTTEVTLPSPRRIDLLSTSGGVLGALGVAPLPAGHYAQVRLVLAADSTSDTPTIANAVQPSGGTAVPLKTPGGQHSGLKLQAELDVDAGRLADLGLQAGACDLVTQAGNSGQYVLKPTVAAQPLDVTLTAKGEFRVNTTTAGNQDQPAVTSMNDGGYVVTWLSDSQDGTGKDVFAQRFDATGSRQASELLLATNLSDPAAAAWPDGGFVVTWTGLGSSGLSNIYAQRFDAGGTPLGSPTQVNDTVAYGGQAFSSVAALADGGFAVGWRTMDFSYGIGVQRFDASGVRVGGLIQLVRVDIRGNVRGRMFALPDGGFMVTWSSVVVGQQYLRRAVYVQRFDAAGNPVTAPIMLANSEANPVTQPTVYGYGIPAVAALDNGRYQVTWSAWDLDGTVWNVYAQGLDPSGALVGGPVRVNSTTAGNQDQPAIAALGGAGYVVTWTSDEQDGSGYGIYAQRFDPGGGRVGGETLVNSTTAANQVQPAVAGVRRGGWVVTWASEGQDGSGYGVYGQQFDAQGLRR